MGHRTVRSLGQWDGARCLPSLEGFTHSGSQQIPDPALSPSLLYRSFFALFFRELGRFHLSGLQVSRLMVDGEPRCGAAAVRLGQVWGAVCL